MTRERILSYTEMMEREKKITESLLDASAAHKDKNGLDCHRFVH